MDTLIICHIPKTAGRTLQHLLVSSYSSDKVLLNAHRLLADASKGDLDQYQLIMGHIGFGVHQKLASREFKYLSFMRDPIKRVISLYEYTKLKPDQELHELAKKMSLAEFIESRVTKETYNDQTTLISGIRVTDDSVGEQALNAAIFNIDNYFPVVGITERFAESWFVIRQKLDLPYKFYFARNVNKNKEIHKLSSREEEVIREANKFDIQLYDYANKSLSKEIDSQSLVSTLKMNSEIIFNKPYSLIQENLRKLKKSLSKK